MSNKSIHVIGIMAADPQGAIGKDGRLPWDYPDELEHFRSITRGHVVIMGRKTFESTPLSFFKERTPIVFSRQQTESQSENSVKCIFVSSLRDFLSRKSLWEGQKIYMIGGAEIAHLFLEFGLITEFILTIIHKSYEGDVYLNLKLLEGWTGTIMSQTENFTIYDLKNPMENN